MELTSAVDQDCDVLNLPRYFQISQFSSVDGEDMLLFDSEGFRLQIINVYDGGMGFGRRTELSALRKMVNMLQSGIPKWTETELMMMTEFFESTQTDDFNGGKLTTRLGRDMLESIRSEEMDIELRNVHDVPDELCCLFENESDDSDHLSLIPLSKFLPNAQSVAFTNLSLDRMEQRTDEYMDCITEYVESLLPRDRSFRRIEFRSEYLGEIPKFDQFTKSLEESRGFSNLTKDALAEILGKNKYEIDAIQSDTSEHISAESFGAIDEEEIYHQPMEKAILDANDFSVAQEVHIEMNGVWIKGAISRKTMDRLCVKIVDEEFVNFKWMENDDISSRLRRIDKEQSQASESSLASERSGISDDGLVVAQSIKERLSRKLDDLSIDQKVELKMNHDRTEGTVSRKITEKICVSIHVEEFVTFQWIERDQIPLKIVQVVPRRASVHISDGSDDDISESEEEPPELKEWMFEFQCHEQHYLSISAVVESEEKKERAHSKTFDLILEAKEEIFDEFDEDKMHEVAHIAINTVLRWNEVDDSSFNVDVVDVHINGVHIEYLMISDDEKQLDLVANVVRGADLKGIFVEFESMLIPIRSHCERIVLSVAERVMMKEVDQKQSEKLAGDLQSAANDAQKDWTSKRNDKVDGNRHEILEKEKTEKEEADRKKAESRATERRLEHELCLNLLTGCKMVDQPLFRLNTEQFWQCIGWWIENDVKHQNSLSAMTKVCAEYHISGAVLCYVFLEQVDDRGLIEKVLRKQMEQHVTVETMDIIMKTMKKWMFTVNVGALHSASTQLAARMMIQIPIQNLKNVLMEKQVDGKWFIKESQKEPNEFTEIVQRSTGWSKSDSILLTEVMLRRISLTKDQILERMLDVGRRNWEDVLTKEAITEMRNTISSAGTLESVQFELRTRGTVQRQFSDSVLKLMKELKPELAGDRFERAFFDVASSGIMINDGGESGQCPWICCFCGNLNVVDIVDCLATTDISTCSLCGIKHKDAVVMALRKEPTPFLGKSSDSESSEIPPSPRLSHPYGANLNEVRKSMDSEHALDIAGSANILSLERSWVDADDDRKSMVMSIREEVHHIVSQDAFTEILCEAIRIYKEWNEALPGTRRANEYAARHGILRNQSITVKHVAAILLYVKHSKLSDKLFRSKSSELYLLFSIMAYGVVSTSEFVFILVPNQWKILWIIYRERSTKRSDFLENLCCQKKK